MLVSKGMEITLKGNINTRLDARKDDMYMKIKDSLPFDKCYDCKDCVLSVKDQTIFSNNELQNQLVVRCRNCNKNCKRGDEIKKCPGK